MSRILAAAAVLATALATAGGPAAAAAAAPAGPGTAAVAHFVLAEFGYDQGWRVDRHPRELADITGDGRADIVGFGDAGVWTAVATGDGGFAPARYVLRGFGYDQGWRVDRHPRFVVDLDADGRADILGVGETGVETAISSGDGTFVPGQAGGPLGGASAVAAGSRWFAADTNSDDRTDLVLINNDSSRQTRIARSLGGGTFSPAHTATTAYDFVNFDPGHYRLADVTGDGRAEILALQVIGPIRMVSSVPILNGTGDYTAPQPAGAAFPPGLPAPPVTLSAVTDVTGDGRADLVAFGTSAPGTWVAPSQGNGTFGAYRQGVADFGEDQGWTSTRHARRVGDITGPDATGRTGDLVGFGDAGIYTSVARGDGTFTPGAYVLADFGYDQGWRVERHPRLVADITGEGRADVVGFGDAGVYTATSRGDGAFDVPADVVVPDLRGRTTAGATAALQAAGLVLGQRRLVLDNSCTNIGLVVRQSPLAGSPMSPGTAVDIWVGTRPLRVCP